MKPDPILKAIDDTHAYLLRQAMQIYNERMKSSRRKLAAARAALVRAQQEATAAERKHNAELEKNRAEAARWRDEEKHAVRGVRPARISDVEAVTRVTTREQVRVSLPRLRCLEEPIEISERGARSA